MERTNDFIIQILLACAALVHDFSSVVPRQLAETVIAVNNRPVHNLRISQQETGLWNKIRREKVPKTPVVDWRWSFINETRSSRLSLSAQPLLADEADH